MIETEILFRSLGMYLDPLLLLAKIAVTCLVVDSLIVVCWGLLWGGSHLRRN